MQVRPSLIFIFSLVLGIFALESCGPSVQQQKEIDQKVDKHKVAQIKWRDLSHIDTVKVGETVVRDYIFYNTGWKPVQIKHAIPNRPECTCSIPQREVPIGEQDTVRLKCLFTEPEARVGIEIVIEHNTPQNSMTLVYITRVE